MCIPASPLSLSRRLSIGVLKRRRNSLDYSLRAYVTNYANWTNRRSSAREATDCGEITRYNFLNPSDSFSFLTNTRSRRKAFKARPKIERDTWPPLIYVSRVRNFSSSSKLGSSPRATDDFLRIREMLKFGERRIRSLG